LLPGQLSLDLYEEKAYISIVPFFMSGIRFPFLPSLPFTSLWELNIRTYVKINNIPGIYFFTLDTNHRLASLIARTFFKLPYRKVDLKGYPEGNSIRYKSSDFSLSACFKKERVKSQFDEWICERYNLFTVHKERVFQGTAIHRPWDLVNIEAECDSSRFLKAFGIEKADYINAFAGKKLDVKFKKFKTL
jgi:uncharacterized protein YqjF (DUF2071 family)